MTTDRSIWDELLCGDASFTDIEKIAVLRIQLVAISEKSHSGTEKTLNRALVETSLLLLSSSLYCACQHRACRL